MPEGSGLPPCVRVNSVTCHWHLLLTTFISHCLFTWTGFLQLVKAEPVHHSSRVIHPPTLELDRFWCIHAQIRFWSRVCGCYFTATTFSKQRELKMTCCCCCLAVTSSSHLHSLLCLGELCKSCDVRCWRCGIWLVICSCHNSRESLRYQVVLIFFCPKGKIEFRCVNMEGNIARILQWSIQITTRDTASGWQWKSCGPSASLSPRLFLTVHLV